MSSKLYSVEISDPELREALDSADNKSEVIRQGVRKLVNGDRPTRMSGLEDAHRTAYNWLRGRGLVQLGEAESSLAVETQLDKQLVRISALEPLREMGLIKVQTGMKQVTVRAIAPVECFDCGADVPPEKVGDHMRTEHREAETDE